MEVQAQTEFSCVHVVKRLVWKSNAINYTKPCYSNLEYLQLCDGKTVLKKSHKYYTQCMLQMVVT